MPASRTLVVGTTPDYVDIIRRRFPDRALFLIDSESSHWSDRREFESDEVSCDLSDHENALVAVKLFVSTSSIAISGIASYDCESLSLAAYIAEQLKLSFPSISAVTTCRDKYATQRTWHAAGVPSPKTSLIKSERDAIAFQESLGKPVVIKPLTGSGSELVMKCSNRAECSAAISTMLNRLSGHSDRRMYSAVDSDHDPRSVFMIQEYVTGDEFSCDFVVNGDRVEIIRIAKKIMAVYQPIGTTLAYIVPSELPESVGSPRFIELLRKAAHAVGIERSICMLDFKIRDGVVILIELSPRPGGDCLPELLMRSGGFDTIGYALDFAEGIEKPIPDISKWSPLVGLRLIAERGGKIAQLDCSHIQEDKRVIECGFKRSVGHVVTLPPDDYDSRILGHVIFKPNNIDSVAAECSEIASKLTLKMENEEWKSQKAS